MDVSSFIKKALDGAKSSAARASGLVRRRKEIIVLVAAITAMVMLMSVVLIRRNDVKIYEDGELVGSFTTLDDSVDEWLTKAGVTLEEGDKVTAVGSEVYVERAFYVTVVADGNRITVKTTPVSAAAILELAGVTLGENDITDAAADELVTQPREITVNRVASETVVESETVDFKTVKEETDKLYVGQTEVKQKGETGRIEYTYEITLIDGKETERTLVSKETVKEPVDKIVLVGTKKKPTAVKTASAGKGAPSSYKTVYSMRATAYTYGDDGGNRTCTGIRPYKGVVAVDPSVIPLGTRLYIVSEDGSYVYGEAVAADIGGSIKGDRIDVFLETLSQANAFGRRRMLVYVL